MQLPLAISLGDPAGIGPELIAEAWANRLEQSLTPFFAVGGKSVIDQAAKQRGIALATVSIADPSEAAAAFRHGLPVLGNADADYHPGEPSEAGAQLAMQSLETAASLALSGDAGGLVTGPISKAAMARIGFAHPGQTEFVAEASGTERQDAVMMLAGPQLRTVPMTVHCPLAEVPKLLSIELICRRTRIVHRALQTDLGISAPRIAICGLNPHAGEDGKMGKEESEIIAPAIAQLKAEDIHVTGPHPADSLFSPRSRENFDVAIAMYHDQALIPLKALDFDHGVNVTLGLPIVRTSPDHGTAFAIAGTGAAHPGATIAAIRMAGEMAAMRASR